MCSFLGPLASAYAVQWPPPGVPTGARSGLWGPILQTLAVLRRGEGGQCRWLRGPSVSVEEVHALCIEKKEHETELRSLPLMFLASSSLT